MVANVVIIDLVGIAKRMGGKGSQTSIKSGLMGAMAGYHGGGMNRERPDNEFDSKICDSRNHKDVSRRPSDSKACKLG